MYDVIVVGLGAMGSAAAYHLSRRGLNVLGLEAFPEGHSLGSSHGESRVIRLAYFEHPDYVPLLQRSYALWRELEEESGASLLLQTGGLFIGASDGTLVRGSLESVRQHGLSHELLDAEAIRQAHPALRPREFDVAVYEEPAGLLFPERCVEAHVRGATRAGATVRYAEAVESWQATVDGVEVQTRQAHYSAARLVVTAGAWLGKVLAELKLPLQPERVPLLWFEPRETPEYFSPDRFPIWLWDVGEPGLFYGFPHLQWPGVKVARHHSGRNCDPDTIQREMTPEDETPVRDFVSRYIPALDGPLVAGRICMYTNSPDSHFIVDRHPEFSSVVYAGGFSGHGFKFASVIGVILADLTVDDRTLPEADFLRASRLRTTTVVDA